MVRPDRAAHTGSRRFVHLTVDQGCLGDNAGLRHSLYRSLPSRVRSLTPAKRNSRAGSGDIVDQLLDQNGLANAGTAEQTDLTALGIGDRSGR